MLCNVTHIARLRSSLLDKSKDFGVVGFSGTLNLQVFKLLVLNLFRAFVAQQRVFPHSIVIAFDVLKNFCAGIVHTQKAPTFQ